MGCSSDRAFGQPYGANVVLPKQLLLEAVQDVVKKGTASGVADREDVLRRLEGVLSEGYEGVGWTIFQAGRKLDRQVRETLVRGLVEYINGPEAPTSGDELTFFITREIMREFAPRLILVNFWDMDVAHWGSYSLYLNAITKTDRLTGNVVGRGAGERQLSWQDYDAGASGVGAGRRPEYSERIFEPSQRGPLVPKYVAACDGGGGSARGDGADGVPRGCGRHRG